MHRHPPSNVPQALALPIAAMLSIAIVLLLGIPRVGHNGGYDADFALRLTGSAISAVHRGNLLPRWLPEASDGFGAPIFLFYGPLAFVAPAILLAPLHLGAAPQLSLAIAAFGLLRLVGTALWLRRHVGARVALSVAAIGTLLPFTLLESVCRVAPAEIAAAAFLPWALLAVDRGPAAPLRRAAMIALPVAAIVASHPIHGVFACAVLPAYALLAHGRRRGLLVLSACALGLAASAVTFLPALLERPLITASAWSDIALLTPRVTILFGPGALPMLRLAWFEETTLSATWLIAASLCVPSLVRAWRGQDGAAAIRPPAIMLALLLFATSAPSLPLWEAVPALDVVQFPWRLLVEAVPFALLALARLVEAGEIRTAAVRRLGMAGLAFLLIPIAGEAASRFRPAEFRNILPRYAQNGRVLENRPFAFPDAPEYAPPGAAALGFRLTERTAIPPDDPRRRPQLPPGAAAARRADGMFEIASNLARPGVVRLPILAFPFFRMSDPRLSVGRDPRSGLVTVTLPAGPVRAVLRRVALPPERWGDRISAVLLPVLLALSLRARPSARRLPRSDRRSPAPSRPPPPASRPDARHRPAAVASRP